MGPFGGKAVHPIRSVFPQESEAEAPLHKNDGVDDDLYDPFELGLYEHPWRPHRARRMGTQHRPGPAVHPTPLWAEPAGGGRAFEFEESRGGAQVKTRRWLSTVPNFVLVPQVKLRKRLDLARDAERAIDAAPGRIVAVGLIRLNTKHPKRRSALRPS